MKKYLAMLSILTILVFGLSIGGPTKAASSNATQYGQTTVRQSQSASSLCTFNLPYPDATCTPGAIFPDVTADQVCTPGYSGSVRNVPQSVKNQVYANYGIASHVTGQYEVDHFIALELGGSNDISNLWPEPASPTPGFHNKDTVENYLHRQVCNGIISLSTAQSEISTDWVAVYNSMP